jgi:hypothetical protein
MAEEAEIADAHEQATIQHESARTCQCCDGLVTARFGVRGHVRAVESGDMSPHSKKSRSNLCGIFLKMR